MVMWKSFLSVVKNIDIAGFLLEETCRYCGQTVPSIAEQERNGSVPNERNCPPSGPKESSKMSLVLETQESTRPQARLIQRPPSNCLCEKCSAQMWQSRQSIWSLPIVSQRPSSTSSNLEGTTSGTTNLLVVATAGVYEGPMQKLIRRLKYDDDRLVVTDLGRILTRAYEMLLTTMPELLDDKDDIFLVPIPLHSDRQHKRGYNQAELIAREFAKLKHLKVENQVLIRKRKTRPQYGLGRKERLINIEGAFEFVGKDIRNKTAIIVDDVFTSGATLTSCAALLTECGARRVTAMAAARAPYDKSSRVSGV